MSDSEHSAVTYTSVSSPVEDYSDIGSLGVDGPPSPDYVPGPEEPEQAPPSLDYVHGSEEPEQAPPLPDYVPGPEEPEQAPPSPVYLPYVPEPVYPKYMPPVDDVFPATEKPLLVATSPTVDSSGYIPNSDSEGDPEEEDDEKDPEEDPADYPADRGDDDDEEEDEEEEEEHLAPADSTAVALPAVDHVPSKEETEPVKIDECAATPPSPLIPYSSPLPQIPSPPLPIPPLVMRSGREDLVGAIKEIAPTTLEGVNQRVTNLSTTVEQETTIMYGMMEDAQDDRSLLRA
ncbi:hypothetical protein Tco_1158321 [Tanacetum coccineum]